METLSPVRGVGIRQCHFARSHVRFCIMSQVPTMAIENIYLTNNTSVIQDEVLAHRIGLVPLAVDPRVFEFFDSAFLFAFFPLRVCCGCEHLCLISLRKLCPYDSHRTP